MRQRHLGQIEIGQLFPGHHACGKFCQRHPGCFSDKRHRAAAPWIDLKQIDILILDGELHIHQPDDIERPRQRLGLAAQLGKQRCRQVRGGSGVAGMDSGFLDMFHDPAI